MNRPPFENSSSFFLSERKGRRHCSQSRLIKYCVDKIRVVRDGRHVSYLVTHTNEAIPLDSEGAREYLTAYCVRITGQRLSRPALRDVVGLLRAKASSEAQVGELPIRTGVVQKGQGFDPARGDVVVIDLARPDGAIVLVEGPQVKR
jgi:hypothetical protein